MGRGSASHANNPSPQFDRQGGAPQSATETPITDASVAEGHGQEASDRSGHDERRRGWFWHWNGIVTQYTPLIGLKGIGLLNSYTVWTDRREDSPHRGYAFPSQQSEANFYGEDRSELITINKILVALDLIEIRKEMVRKVDEQGRRWKVPQNLYRVKDRQHGLDLTAGDVIRVIELANRDKAVYRHIRKVFSTKFEPIDRDNVWHQILVEIAEHPTWKKLSERAAKQEAKASARTKAGHRSRARQQLDGDGNDQEKTEARNGHDHDRTVAEMTTGHISEGMSGGTEHSGAEATGEQTIADDTSNGLPTTDERANNGFESADDRANNGSRGTEGGNVANANHGYESSVEPGNTMYYESSSTTTTTTSAPQDQGDDAGAAVDRIPLDLEKGREAVHRSEDGSNQRSTLPPADLDEAIASQADATLSSGTAGSGEQPAQRDLVSGLGSGPVGDPSPLVLSLYEAANDRPPTRLERILLSELERDAGPPSEAAGATGADWVAAALREAVGSGSAFVAPKRIREIINRWASSGAGPRGASPSPARIEDVTRQARASLLSGSVTIKQELGGTREESATMVLVSATDAQQGEQLWGVVLDMLATGIHGGDLIRLRGVMPLGERNDHAFLLGAPTRLAVRLLEGACRPAIEDALSALLSSPVKIAVLEPGEWSIVD